MLSYNGLKRLITEFVSESPLNKIKEFNDIKIYQDPLVGIAHAIDLFFFELKSHNIVGTHHMAPEEWMIGAKSIVSYFLPFSEEIRSANRTDGLPAIEWVYARIEGELLNNGLRDLLVKEITNKGFKCIAPPLDERYSVVKNKSNWSERHVAFIAGLGTFSLGRSLITEKGCAGRFGSIIVDFEIDKTPRDYGDFEDYCNMCGECIDRCPVNAITINGKNIDICADYVNNTIRPMFSPRYGCGKCQTKVQCEGRKP